MGLRTSLSRREPKTRDSTAPLVLFNGRFVERKGIRELMEAIEIVLGQAPAVQFVLAGGHRGCSGAQMESWLLPANSVQCGADSVHRLADSPAIDELVSQS